jgi:hypothetical protein
MNRVLVEYRIAMYDYDEILKACMENPYSEDLKDQCENKKQILSEKEDTMITWAKSLGRKNVETAGARKGA